jgi:hypothetical protein
VPRLAAPTVLFACAASLFAAPTAAASLRLPPGADARPDLPAGVVVAEHPKATRDGGQGAPGGLAVASAHSERSDAGEARPFWATVNICDTKNSPNALGIRTSVPGNGTRQRIFARYTAQWWSEADQQWLTVAGSGVTPWAFVGTADMASLQAGWTFTFVQPPEGTTYVMRGVVELEWRDTAAAARRARHQRARQERAARKHHRARSSAKRRRHARAQRNTVVQRRVLLTQTGMKGVQGGDPPGLSKAMCLIW